MTTKPEPDGIRIPPWVFLLLGLAGGGASGTVLSRPVFGGDGVSRLDVEQIVEEKLEHHDECLLQKMELMLARDQLRAAGRNSVASPSADRVDP
jgi:hypothetical protein